jgi:hypothetical protein
MTNPFSWFHAPIRRCAELLDRFRANLDTAEEGTRTWNEDRQTIEQGLVPQVRARTVQMKPLMRPLDRSNLRLETRLINRYRYVAWLNPVILGLRWENMGLRARIVTTWLLIHRRKIITAVVTVVVLALVVVLIIVIRDNWAGIMGFFNQLSTIFTP